MMCLQGCEVLSGVDMKRLQLKQLTIGMGGGDKGGGTSQKVFPLEARPY
jgi:hypothetical protein